MWRRFFAAYGFIFVILGGLELAGLALAFLGLLVNEGPAAFKWFGVYTLICCAGTIAVVIITAVARKKRMI